MLMKLWKDESGQGMIEYALLMVLVLGIIILGIAALKGPLSDMFDGVEGQINTAVSSANAGVK